MKLYVSALFLLVAPVTGQFLYGKDRNWLYCAQPGKTGEWCYLTRSDCVLLADGTGTCTCKAGWKKSSSDARYCDADIDECTENTPYPCDPAKGVCVNRFPFEGQYRCECPLGYNGLNDKGFGPTQCVDTNSCFFNESLCDKNAVCVFKASTNTYSCQCDYGYEGNGATCSPVAPQNTQTTGCSSCGGNRICGVDDQGRQVCVCPTTYTGE